MKIVYVLQASAGNWEEYKMWILGIFDCYKLAEKEMHIYNHSIKFDKNKYSFEEYDRLDKLEDEQYKLKIDEELFSDELKEFAAWKELDQNELHNSKIEIYELNELI